MFAEHGGDYSEDTMSINPTFVYQRWNGSTVSGARQYQEDIDWVFAKRNPR
jgi:hypothetical protein